MPNPSWMPSVMGLVPQNAVLDVMPAPAISCAAVMVMPPPSPAAAVAPAELAELALPPELAGDDVLEQAARASAAAAAMTAGSALLTGLGTRIVVTYSSGMVGCGGY
jgi:hypothetical protein